MQPWPGSAVPPLPGSPPALRLWDTASRSLRIAAAGPVATMYVCGITPYDATHLGHAATYVAFDLVHRAWLDSGLQVHYVQNVTDVDDPLLERAVATGQDWRELASEQTALFSRDMVALRVLPPRSYVGAVETIPRVAELVAALRDAGAAYDVDGDLYFAVRSAPGFGTVAGLDEQQMRDLFAERGGDPDRPGKRDPLDCLLWQAARPGEPSWDSPLGPGRPGWHLECVAIALDTIGMPFDVQGGGRDLAFPHHEMGAAEACTLRGGTPYARTYVHAGMVGLDGEKMSKSRGNLVFVSRLLAAGHDPAAVRLALLAHHYRDDWEWSDAELARAQARLVRWRKAFEAQSGPSGEQLLSAVRERLSDDLDAPGALAAVDAWVGATELGADVVDPQAPALAAATVDALLGVEVAG
ncbi:MAG: cysteine--1-D-myo-inosityl 2-amino-2-deoxy-alpha-D-glucopyranoside ligase [Actinomycetota bacterium]|nr:MAG: cysteine--1-D-myo-inosityl 2-amino-2-deoxy-alpha-D-glucopyranoside ligase [Actinomycetota bacterium]